MIFWLAIPLTLALYFATRTLYRRLPWPIINPVLVPTAVIIGLLDKFTQMFLDGRIHMVSLALRAKLHF